MNRIHRGPLSRQLALAGLVVIGLALVVVALSQWQSDDTAPRQTPQGREPSRSQVPAEQPDRWRAPRTTDPRVFAEAFATAVWTYDSRVHTYDQWRTAITGFVDPTGTPASRQVALGVLPSWRQWEDLARQSAHARVASLRTTVPAELAALRNDPRAPSGWHGFVVSAEQIVATEARQSKVVRQASVSVVCAPRCHLWSVTPEGPG